jgi:Lamin Tail Domain
MDRALQWRIRSDQLKGLVPIRQYEPMEDYTGDYSVLGNNSTSYTDYVLTGLSLTSTSDFLSLHDAKRKLRDRVEWNTSWPTTTVGASMALRSPTLDNAERSHWCVSPTAFLDGHENKSKGTPGSGNNCPEARGTIRFSEYMRRPGLGRSIWIELYNNADYPVNLKGWSWTTSYISANSGPIPTDMYIPAKGYFVYGRYNGTNATVDVVPNYYQANLRMTPSLTDQLIVWDPNDNFHDYVNVDASWSIMHGASMALKHPSLDRNVESHWCVSSTILPSGVNGTPGAANDCAATQAPSRSPSVAPSISKSPTSSPSRSPSTRPSLSAQPSHQPFAPPSTMPSVSASPSADFVNIVINEIMIHPSTDTPDLVQWIELYNGGSGPVNLKGWFLSDDTSQWKITSNLLIDVGDYVVFGSKSTVYTDYVLNELLLSQAGDFLVLYDSKHKLQDRVEWDGTWPMGGMGTSRSLRSPTLDNAEFSHWCSTPTTFLDGHQNTSKGTPGSGNNCPEEFRTVQFSEYIRRPGHGRSVWIELYNNAEYSVNLKGWRWTTSWASADSGVISMDLYIPAKGYFVYGQYNGTNATQDVVPNYYQANLRLTSELDEQLILYDPNDGFHDFVTIREDWFIPDGASMALQSPSLNKMQESSWCVSRTVHPSGIRGTPGAANDCV